MLGYEWPDVPGARTFGSLSQGGGKWMAWGWGQTRAKGGYWIAEMVDASRVCSAAFADCQDVNRRGLPTRNR